MARPGSPDRRHGLLPMRSSSSPATLSSSRTAGAGTVRTSTGGRSASRGYGTRTRSRSEPRRQRFPGDSLRPHPSRCTCRTTPAIDRQHDRHVRCLAHEPGPSMWCFCGKLWTSTKMLYRIYSPRTENPMRMSSLSGDESAALFRFGEFTLDSGRTSCCASGESSVCRPTRSSYCGC